MKSLKFKWTISKGRDTYGYNILTLLDGSTKYRTCGGGYDMQGTVFAKWLITHYRERIEKLQPSAPVIKPFEQNEGYYGLFVYDGKFRLDGACGLECIIKIAKAIGLEVGCIYHKGLEYITINDTLKNAI